MSITSTSLFSRSYNFTRLFLRTAASRRFAVYGLVSRMGRRQASGSTLIHIGIERYVAFSAPAKESVQDLLRQGREGEEGF